MSVCVCVYVCMCVCESVSVSVRERERGRGEISKSRSLSPRYGIFERCRELVDAGYDVRQPDKENVTLLHWAAINNRIDLVK